MLVRLIDSAFNSEYRELRGLSDDATEIREPDGHTYLREPALDEPDAIAFVCRCSPVKHGAQVV